MASDFSVIVINNGKSLAFAKAQVPSYFVIYLYKYTNKTLTFVYFFEYYFMLLYSLLLLHTVYIVLSTSQH